ncbi:MAG: AbrB/MazE/SpoVT family DNA-binding domain-containing protein [Candidatus Njordarchaeales archaeon]
MDSKGRISIPISLRAKLGWLEGSRVKISICEDELVLSSSGQNGVKVSIGVCGTSDSGSIPDSGLDKTR